MTTVELFAGIGGFRIAADRLGWQTVWANDSCPRACTVYRDNFGPTPLREGDLRHFLAEVPPHDVLTAGFPCQPFSSAGKKQGVRDARGTLFELIVAVLMARQPRYFVLENVKRLLTMERGGHFATILDALAHIGYAVEWRLLNARHFGLAQNRERVVIVGSRDDGAVRLAGETDLSPVPLEALVAPSAWREIARHGLRFPPWGLAKGGRFVGATPAGFSAAAGPVTLARVLEAEPPAGFDFTAATLARLGGNRPVNRYVNGVEVVSNQRGGARMGYTIFGVNGLAPTLTSTASRHYERYQVGDRYRRLTNVEYARLQGFPDDHCRALSVYDQYARFGNAVPPPVVAWVLGRLTG